MQENSSIHPPPLIMLKFLLFSFPACMYSIHISHMHCLSNPPRHPEDDCGSIVSGPSLERDSENGNCTLVNFLFTEAKKGEGIVGARKPLFHPPMVPISQERQQGGVVMGPAKWKEFDVAEDGRNVDKKNGGEHKCGFDGDLGSAK